MTQIPLGTVPNSEIASFVLQVDAVLVADVADGKGMEELGLAADAEAKEFVGVLGEPALESAGGDAGQGGELAF